MSSVSMPSQPLIINVVQFANPKGNQQSDGKKKWSNKKKDKDGKDNANKPNNNVREGKKSRKINLSFLENCALETI